MEDHRITIPPERVRKRLGSPASSTRNEHLTDHHRHLLETESAIAPEIIAERGYFSAHTRDDVPEVFKEHQRRPGLVIPLFSPDDIMVGCQLRAKNHRCDRRCKACKYDNQ